jgi:hypothetical protein
MSLISWLVSLLHLLTAGPALTAGGSALDANGYARFLLSLDGPPPADSSHPFTGAADWHHH